MTHRILSNRRAQEIVDFEQGGYQYRIAVSRFEDGTPAEVLIDSAKPGSTLDTYAQDVATLLSLLMQNGVDLSRIEGRLRDHPGSSLAARVVRLIGGAA